MTTVGVGPKLCPEIIRGRRALGGGLKSIGQRQAGHCGGGGVAPASGRNATSKKDKKLISEAAFETQSASIGFTGRTAINSSPDMLRKTRLAVARAKEGDREALRFLYVSYSHNIYGYVRSIVRDDHEAEDVTQHVFAKLMTTVGKYDDRGIPFFAWLLRMARNVAIDHLRSNRLTPVETLPDTGSSTEPDIDHFHTVRDALAALPEEQREVVFLRHVVGLSPGEIADRLGRSEPSVHGLHHRGRRALQRELRALETSPSTRPITRRPRAVA